MSSPPAASTEVAGRSAAGRPAGTDERRYVVTERGTAIVRGLSEDDLTYAFNAIPDKPPVIALAKDPEPQARGSLQLNYKMEDDYGVVEAKANFALKGAAAADGGASARCSARPRCRWCCRRPASRTASARPSRI